MFTVNLHLEHKDANNIVMSLINSLPSELNLNLSKLSNLTTYIELANKSSNSNTVINSNDEVLQAINYDSDDNNNYWAILSNDFVFMDVAIPLVADLDDEKLYESFSAHESKVLKSLKEYLN
jgi:hypothetical protein